MTCVRLTNVTLRLYIVVRSAFLGGFQIKITPCKNEKAVFEAAKMTNKFFFDYSQYTDFFHTSNLERKKLFKTIHCQLLFSTVFAQPYICLPYFDI